MYVLEETVGEHLLSLLPIMPSFVNLLQVVLLKSMEINRLLNGSRTLISEVRLQLVPLRFVFFV